MKKIIVAAAIITVSVITVCAQHLPLYNQYTMNKFLLNPAVAGLNNYIPITLTARSQWVGVEGAPSTQILSGDAAPFTAENMGVGGFVYNDNFGPVNITGIGAAYSYTLPLSNPKFPTFFGSDPKLAFGLSITGIFNKVNMDKIEFYDQSDIVNTQAVDQHFVPDAGTGFYFYTKEYFLGLSVGHLLTTRLKYGDSSTGKSMSRQYFLNLGYNLDMNNYVANIKLEPSLLLKMTELNNPAQLDVNLKVKYKDNLWAGLSYRSAKALMIFMGITYDRYIFAYSFDYNFSSLTKSTVGSHEFIIGAKLDYIPRDSDKALF